MMLTPKRMMVVAAVLALWRPAGAAAQSAPASIANSIIEFFVLTDSTSTDELVLFRADGTYQDLHNGGSEFGNAVSFPPASGTYTYAVSLTDPTAGVITITSGSAVLAGTKLVFSRSNEGSLDNSAGYFSFYPGVAQAGAGNVSTRSFVSAAHPMEVGFVIEGDQGRWVLIRGAGPSLAQFAVTGGLANPRITVYSNGTVLSTLSSWSSDPNLVPGFTAIFALAGAFQFTPGSADCAGIMFLAPGAYVAQGSTGGPEGEILTEVYILPFGP
jgi:hypothetical protein